MEKFKELSNFLKKHTMNFSEIFIENQKYFIKWVIYVLCCYQLCQLLNNYTKFDMKNNYHSHEHFEDISFTLCLEEELVLLDFREYLGGQSVDDEELFIPSRNFRQKECFSYFNNVNFSNYFRFEMDRSIYKSFTMHFLKHPTTINLIAHRDNSPSQFGKLFVLKPKKYQRFTLYEMISEYSIQKLLPWPFEHNCFDYNSPTSKFKSREYCYLDVMKKLEFKYCKVNVYWTINSEFQENATQCIKPDFEHLKMLCKISCLDVKPIYMINENDAKITNFHNNWDYYILIIYRDSFKQRIYLEYIPKLTKLQFFSNIGGLLSMWLGLSFKSLILLIFGTIEKNVAKMRILLSKLKINKANIYLNYLVTLFLILNLKKTFTEFLLGNKITKISIVNEFNLPDFSINEKLLQQIMNVIYYWIY